MNATKAYSGPWRWLKWILFGLITLFVAALQVYALTQGLSLVENAIAWLIAISVAAIVVSVTSWIVIRLWRGLRRESTERMQAEQALQRRNLELTLINQASQAFSSSLELDQVLVTILEEVRRLLEVIACSVWLRDPETDDLVCRQATGPQSDIVRGWRLAMGEGLVGWVASSGENLFVPDALTDVRHFTGVDERTEIELRSILSVPLQVKSRVIGVLQVVDSQPNRFDAADLELVEPLAASAAIAIENAQLYDQTRQDAEIKAVLLQEVHHRVKNNLQVISSLLDLQAEAIEDPKAVQAFEESRNRVRSMSLVHERLYRSQDLARIDMVGYIQDQVDGLLTTYDRGGEVTLDVHVDDVSLGIDTAIPCSLIINELVSNAMKHAFPPGWEGTSRQIHIELRTHDSGRLELVVHDNGVGLPPDLDVQRSPSLGLQLVYILAQQIQGRIDVDRGQGTTFRMTFTDRTDGARL
jgi:two-component sensor histidine kinase